MNNLFLKIHCTCKLAFKSKKSIKKKSLKLEKCEPHVTWYVPVRMMYVGY